MFDPMLTLIAAKAKAVGLVAGTAMVTTALVGGGAVAMTSVSSEGDVQDSAVVAEELAADPTLVEEVVSDTSTVGIGDEDEEAGEEKVRPPLPEDFVCDDTKNHGQNVSAYARSLEKGPGRGQKVSAVAQSDCGKTAGDETEAEAEPAEAEATDEAAEADKAARDAAKAERKAERDAAKAERKADRAAAKTERKAAKPAGKGGGKK